MKKVTIQDIAEQLNISFSTVARALNDHPAISAETKKRVKEAARKMHYRPNKLASSLRSGKTHIIGVIVPSLSLSFFSSVVHGIDTVLNGQQYSVLLYQSEESLDREIKGIDTFLRSRVDGIIASMSRETSHYEHFEEIRKRRVPLVLFDRVTEKLRVPSVRIDDYRGGYMATIHLIEQGYRDIVHITADQELVIAVDRLRGYRDALAAHGLPERVFKGPFSAESGRRCVSELLASGVTFDAIFAVEDFTALGALQELQERGVRVPDEVGVIGFANESFGTLVTPALSTVDQQTIRMGEIAAELFLKASRGETVEPVMLDPILVTRASTARRLG
ncbi:MAG TPA: LacI family DNA-binding transcriptional regulator [Dinghuibacter sp.]|uniref:LacI family DNA-binding transcriptional regulator n=1 Tax=Dinghuibacter sp. TaxID=2024697 RepID=UPI002CAA7174|nr:LacI family DNA-binding transcriptional regulator [Dinghuibacter sp.]HTJ14589.1 LacI family DNA-binding transcriptional regulator [Dinghuibacter sp.]